MRSISRGCGLSLVVFVFAVVVGFGQDAGSRGGVGSGGDEVVVSQQFVDTAARAFIEVKALRELVEEYKRSLALTQESIRLRDEVIRSRTEEVSVLQKKVEALTLQKCSRVSFLFGVVKIKRCH